MQKPKEYAKVYREGVRVRGKWILLISAPSEKVNEARIGLSVGRKFSKSAVLRNRTRRVMKEAFRHIRHQLPALDYVLIPIGPIKVWETKIIQAELTLLAKKAQEKLKS